MNGEIKKHVFFIEGGDNVGKTTAINTFKNAVYVERLKYNRICFSKYPTYKATDNINELNRMLNFNESRYLSSSEINRYEYIKLKKDIIHNTIKFMLHDMAYSFSPETDEYLLKYPDDIVNICDRGFLSTYLYQYKNMPGILHMFCLDYEQEQEHKHLKNFIRKYMPEIENDLNVIILNNNANPLLANIIMGEEETIEYKKQFDNDLELQSRINSSLNNIVGLIKDNKLSDLLPIKFYYINIFDDTGSIRKSPDDICKEIISIINKED